MKTNSNSRLIAALLAEAKVGTFTGLVQTLKGQERGSAGNKVRYGDDTVHVCIFTGFKYDALCQRSLDAIAEMDPAAILAEIKAADLKGWEGRGAKAVQVEVTLDDVKAALAALQESWTLSRDGLNSSTNDHVFEPLVVEGEVVRGCRVYVGPAPGKEPAAKPGTIYLHGLQISRKVLVPAPNGPLPESKSGSVVVAKDFITRKTPMGAYRSYKLEPGSDFLLRAGGSAEIAAEKDGITFTPEIRDALKARVA